ncbi:MAG: type I-E CRISPR-associated endoribonuclease Cas2e [Desulfovibrionaceae bacterium]
MPMALVVVRNAPMRLRGFLASCMLEVSPCVYMSPRLSQAVRERVWGVAEQWLPVKDDASAVMVWQDGSLPAGYGVSSLGEPVRELVEAEGLVLSRLRSVPSSDEETS